MQNTYPPRPRWNHPNVKDAVAKEYVEPVRKWADLHGVEDSADDREFLVAIAMALRESPDAYQAGRYLEDFYEWPVTGELVNVFEGAFNRMKSITRRFVLEWVVEHNVRFPGKKGEGVRFRIGDAELSGTVTELLASEAKALVKINGKTLLVNAEEVFEVTSPAKVKAHRPEPEGPPETA